MLKTPTQQAYNKYNRLYNNTTYQNVRVSVCNDFDVPPDSEDQHIMDIMNLLIDVSLILCEIPDYQTMEERAPERFLLYLSMDPVSTQTIRHAARHLSNFDAARSFDFEKMALSMWKARRARKELYEAASEAMEIRNWQGRAAHYALSAAHAMIDFGISLMRRETPDTINGYLHNADRNRGYALDEIKHGKDDMLIAFLRKMKRFGGAK
jgi:hypothetical protein